jgi:phospholipid transport system substrate-binding protein
MGKAFAAWFLIAATAASPPASPRDVVQGAVARVIAVLQESPDDHIPRGEYIEKRRAEIRRIATTLFDFQDMARRALSRHWAARTPGEQAQFVDAFTDLLERSYVRRIEGYAGEKITYPAEILDGTYATVRSRILTRRRTETSLDYRLHLDDGRWKVFDIAVDGVSFVSTYRSEFNRIIQGFSYAALVDRLRDKRVAIDALARPH